MQALVDIGNTRIKWALLDEGRLVRPGGAVHRGSIDAALQALAAALPPGVERIIVANVAGEDMAQRLRAMRRQRARRSSSLPRLPSASACAARMPSRDGSASIVGWPCSPRIGSSPAARPA